MLEEGKIKELLESIKDPEIPVLSIVDLGIVRGVTVDGDAVTVLLSPTYTGCPAMDLIGAEVNALLKKEGFTTVTIQEALSPAWTTDWISEKGKQALAAYGIAPPDKRFAIPEDGVECPQCHSFHTKLVSTFSSTACKALYQCRDCGEPFDYFKCL